MLRIGTRGSQLALWQANTVAARITASGGPPSSIITIKTSGDRLQEAPLSQIGGKGVFVKEIEDALLNGDIDLAVHSSKDMSAVLPEGLQIGAVLPREDALDAIVFPLVPGAAAGADEEDSANPTLLFSRTVQSIEQLVADLGRSPTLGTGSVRRIAQLTRLLPGARFSPIRGNLDTRLRKLDDGGYDALVLAAAGLSRLGFASRISMRIPASACIPAPGQGIVAIEVRQDNDVVRRAVARIDDAAAAVALDAERALVAALGGGCQIPLGGFASPVDGRDLELMAVVVSVDGSRAVRADARGSADQAIALGQKVAEKLLQDGAGEILEECKIQQAGLSGHAAERT
jgi:hydroxymethylbilane synthase